MRGKIYEEECTEKVLVDADVIAYSVSRYSINAVYK